MSRLFYHIGGGRHSISIEMKPLCSLRLAYRLRSNGVVNLSQKLVVRALAPDKVLK